MNTTTTKEVFWNVSDLDRTPVEDLERWHREYDPVSAADLDAKLDDAFGPVEARGAR